MASDFYDRQGNPLTLDQWMTSGIQKRVAETTLPNGRWVSTAWLGVNHSHGDGPPLIFRTMVFSDNAACDDLDYEWYSTEAEALAGHERMVAKWAAAVVSDVDTE